MLPSRYKKVVDAMDFDGDGKVSQEEIDKAKVEQKKLEEIGSKLCAELRKDIKKAEAG